MQMAKKVGEAVSRLRALGAGTPEKAIFLESHMAGFSNELGHVTVVPFRKIPHCPEAPAPSRSGTLLLGVLAGRPVAVLEGRVHLHDGCLPGETAFPVRLLAALGVRTAVFVADGRALREGLAPGEMLLLSDRLDLTGATPLKGMVNVEAGRGGDVPTVSGAIAARAQAAAAAAGVCCTAGIGALVAGPLWPTPAEQRMLRGFGADGVTMAIAPELAVAAYLGLETAAFLLIDGATWGKRHLDFCRVLLELE